MNRLNFYCENGKTQIELEDVRKIGRNEITKHDVFHVEEKPVYLQIFFHRALTEEELHVLYGILIAYHLIDLDESNVETNIAEDLKRQNPTLGVWEIKCQKFQDAFECCCDKLSKFYMVNDGAAFSFQLSDEPTDHMKLWLRHKSSQTKIIEDLVKIIELDGFADISVGCEKRWNCSREKFNRAIKSMAKNGYHVYSFRISKKPVRIGRIISLKALQKRDFGPIRRQILLNKIGGNA